MWRHRDLDLDWGVSGRPNWLVGVETPNVSGNWFVGVETQCVCGKWSVGVEKEDVDVDSMESPVNTCGGQELLRVDSM